MTFVGLSLVNELATKNSDISIFAGVRDPSNANHLKELSAKNPGKITLIKYISADEEVNKALAKDIETKHGHLDVVIACAGQCHPKFPLLPSVHDLKVSRHIWGRHSRPLLANYEITSRGAWPSSSVPTFSSNVFRAQVNVTGILVLFQAVYPLLKASTSSPRFIPMTSGAGSLTAYISLPFGYTCYGVTKAAVNYIARKIHFENDWLSTHSMLFRLALLGVLTLSNILLPALTWGCTDGYV